VGRYSGSSSGACTLCSKGQYQDSTGSTGCALCAAGYFYFSEGATSCSQCAAGKLATAHCMVRSFVFGIWWAYSLVPSFCSYLVF
jgi:hypothetical protein